MARDIKFLSGLLCDEVRREDNGKLMLLGVYSHSIIVAELPATLVLALAFSMQLSKPKKEIQFQFRVSLDGSVLKTGKGGLRSDHSGQSLMVIPGILLENIEREGVLSFDLSDNGTKWSQVVETPLVLRKA